MLHNFLLRSITFGSYLTTLIPGRFVIHSSESEGVVWERGILSSRVFVLCWLLSLLSPLLGVSRSRRETQTAAPVSAQTESWPELDYTLLIRHPAPHNPVIAPSVVSQDCWHRIMPWPAPGALGSGHQQMMAQYSRQVNLDTEVMEEQVMSPTCEAELSQIIQPIWRFE